MSHDFSPPALANLAQRLNLTNLQLVADSCAKDELERASEVVASLRLQIRGLREKLQDEMKVLDQAKTTCQQLLASAGPPTKAPASKAVPSNNSQASSGGTAPAITAVDEGEFSTVPKYMKGRLTRERINLGVDFFNKALAEKYALLRQNPSKLSVEMRQRYYDLKELDNEETAGRFFITEQDIKSFLASTKNPATFKLDSTGRAILAILRHVGRIREVRSAGVIRFVVLS